jgi:hypothetical protein
MKRIAISALALVGLGVLLSRLPAAVRFAFLRGPGTVVRHQEAWMPREGQQ